MVGKIGRINAYLVGLVAVLFVIGAKENPILIWGWGVRMGPVITQKMRIWPVFLCFENALPHVDNPNPRGKLLDFQIWLLSVP